MKKLFILVTKKYNHNNYNCNSEICAQVSSEIGNLQRFNVILHNALRRNIDFTGIPTDLRFRIVRWWAGGFPPGSVSPALHTAQGNMTSVIDTL